MQSKAPSLRPFLKRSVSSAAEPAPRVNPLRVLSLVRGRADGVEVMELVRVLDAAPSQVEAAVEALLAESHVVRDGSRVRAT